MRDHKETVIEAPGLLVEERKGRKHQIMLQTHVVFYDSPRHGQQVSSQPASDDTSGSRQRMGKLQEFPACTEANVQH